MPIVLPTTILDESEKPQGTQPWIWLWQIELERPTDTPTPSVVLQITSYHEEILWPNAPLTPPKTTWYPFNFDVSPVEENTDGDLPQIDLSIDNTARTVMPYLHAGDGLEGNYAIGHLITEDGILVYPEEEIRWDFVIAGVSATDDAATFRLALPNFFQRKAPADRFVASRCRWGFGSIECGYPINPAAAFTDCNKTVAECIARGADELFRRLPVLHPRRFGGFPGIPRQRNL
jgi:phage-related protein